MEPTTADRGITGSAAERLRPQALVATLVGILTLSGLAGCTTTGSADSDGIGFRQARFDEMESQRLFEACVEEALAVDAQAQANASVAQYRTSALLLERCEDQTLSGATALRLENLRMRTSALAVQNFFKAGEFESARRSLERFGRAFADRDLYYADGTSFVDTMWTLLATDRDSQTPHYHRLNINHALQSELNRAQYWTRH